MRAAHSNRRSPLAYLFLIAAVLVVLVAVVGSACTLGGNEGDRCNPLVFRDECNSGLHCKAADCTASYCCPVNGPSSDPNCNAAGCPDTDGGDEGGADEGGADAGPDAPQPTDGGGSADASDAADASEAG